MVMLPSSLYAGLIRSISLIALLGIGLSIPGIGSAQSELAPSGPDLSGFGGDLTEIPPTTPSEDPFVVGVGDPIVSPSVLEVRLT